MLASLGVIESILFSIFVLLPVLLSVVGTLAGLWKMFEKAGQPGWAAIVPIYNIVIWCRIVGRPEWWVILTLIPLVGLVVMIILLMDMMKAFGRGAGTALLCLFFGIGYLIIGFGDAQYVGSGGSAPRHVL